MAAFFLKQSSRGHARSISLPSRSHPTTLKIEEELNKLVKLEVSSSSSSSSSYLRVEKLCMAISSLVELYQSTGDLLQLPQTLQALTKHHGSSWVNELLEESVSFLDVCGNTRECISLLSESMAKLQSSLRRRNNVGELCIEDDVTYYVHSLKNLKKEMGKSLSNVKHIEGNKSALVSPVFKLINNNDQHLVAVVRVLKETSLISNVVFKAILGYFSAVNLQPKPNKWALVLKMVHNKGNASDHSDVNELGDVEIALNSLMVRKLNKEETITKVEAACKKLDGLEKGIEKLDKELECLFRQLIRVRVSLLNIISHH